MKAVVIALGVGLAAIPEAAWAGGDPIDVLVYSRTTGFRHDSIPAGIAAVQQMGLERGWTVTASEDPLLFSPRALAAFDVIVFLSTTGDVLDETQQGALQGWVQAGGGFVGIHSATNTEEDWPWFVGLLGTTFADHPAPQTATVHVVDPRHPATEPLPDPWVRFDEWYNFDSNPSRTVHVLLRLDETSYTGGTMGRDHPIAWAHEYDGGRSFYTALGHTIESFSEPEFLAHVAGGIEWAAAPPDPAGDESSSDGGASGDADTSGDDAPGTGDPDGTGAPMSGSTGGDAPSSTTDAVGDDATGSGAPAGGATTDDASGCGCSARAPARPEWAGLVILGALGLSRRPRTRSGRPDRAP